MTNRPKSDPVTGGAIAAGAIAVACCAGLPLAAGAIAAIGGLAFGAIAAAGLLLLIGGFALIRRRRHACTPSSQHKPAR